MKIKRPSVISIKYSLPTAKLILLVGALGTSERVVTVEEFEIRYGLVRVVYRIL